MKFRNVWVIAAVLSLSACATTMDLRSPVPLESEAAPRSQSILFHVDEGASSYEFKGNINVQPLTIAFGKSLKSTLAAALAQKYESVSEIGAFPPASDSAPSVSVEFSEVTVNPGALTFSSSSASVELRARFQVPGDSTLQAVRIKAKAEASPGAQGAIPIPGLNDSAYNNAIRRASELALARAVVGIVNYVETQTQE